MLRRDNPATIVGFSRPFFQGGVGLSFYATRGALPPALAPLSIALIWTRRKHCAVLRGKGTGSLTHTFLAN